MRCGHGLLAGVERAAVLRVATAGTPPYAEGTSPNADARHSFSLELLTASRVRRTGDIPSHETTAVTDAVDSRIVREIPFGWMSLGARRSVGPHRLVTRGVAAGSGSTASAIGGRGRRRGRSWPARLTHRRPHHDHHCRNCFAGRARWQRRYRDRNF